MASASPEAPSLHPDSISPIYVTFLVVASVMTFLSTVCTILRFIQRKSLGFMWDDWCILGALVFAFGFLTTTILVAIVVHAGYHVNEYVLWELNTHMKISLANNIIYNASITLSKASVIYLYYRIFGIDRSLRLQLRIVTGLLVGYFLAAFFGLLFSNNPVRAQWNLMLPHTTINNKVFWCSMAVINMSLDLVILAIPQARVWRLKMTIRRRVLVSLVFLLGAFVIVASCVRIVFMLTVDVNDLTYTFAVPGIWTNVELNVSIICANLPVIYSLFKPDTERNSNGSSSKSEPLAFGSTRPLHRQYEDLEMPKVTTHSTLHDVHIESGAGAGELDYMSDREPLSPPHVRREFRMTAVTFRG